MTKFNLNTLEAVIAERPELGKDLSYSSQLLHSGINRCVKKFGEEANEFIIAALVEKEEDTVCEAADLLFHFLIVLKKKNIPLSKVYEELASRRNKSGLEEKAARKPSHH